MARKNILNTKVLLKSSSLMKFSQNFSAVKMVATASYLWFVQPVVGSYISIGVCYCFIQQQGQCEKSHQLGKAISSHIFFISALSRNCECINKLLMKLKDCSVNYTTPHTEIIEMEVETAILSSSNSNVENPVEGEESDW